MQINADEFWAGTITKAIHGKGDTYSRKVVTIAKKHTL
jgi:hypothetical protein